MPRRSACACASSRFSTPRHVSCTGAGPAATFLSCSALLCMNCVSWFACCRGSCACRGSVLQHLPHALTYPLPFPFTAFEPGCQEQLKTRKRKKKGCNRLSLKRMPCCRCRPVLPLNRSEPNCLPHLLSGPITHLLCHSSWPSCMPVPKVPPISWWPWCVLLLRQFLWWPSGVCAAARPRSAKASKSSSGKAKAAGLAPAHLAYTPSVEDSGLEAAPTLGSNGIQQGPNIGNGERSAPCAQLCAFWCAHLLVQVQMSVHAYMSANLLVDFQRHLRNLPVCM